MICELCNKEVVNLVSTCGDMMKTIKINANDWRDFSIEQIAQIMYRLNNINSSISFDLDVKRGNYEIEITVRSFVRKLGNANN